MARQRSTRNFWCARPMLVGPRKDRVVIRDLCKNTFWGAPGLVIGPCIVAIDRIVIREVQYQTETNRGDSGQDGRTGRRLPVDPSINLKEDGNQAAFTFINGTGMDNVDMDGRFVIRDIQY
ncbi:hypothetical protein DPMN_065600 [Dreissena polymorpha]|uniref:Uncharacterized protein n=1 Tax=Dreissena polymorpha TaxID=45954 RepID=A0A9D4BSB8_DREPO|nr:hypothetical protein DPMN_065600 [Dreissena polymorpha]